MFFFSIVVYVICSQIFHSSHPWPYCTRRQDRNPHTIHLVMWHFYGMLMDMTHWRLYMLSVWFCLVFHCPANGHMEKFPQITSATSGFFKKKTHRANLNLIHTLKQTHPSDTSTWAWKLSVIVSYRSSFWNNL